MSAFATSASDNETTAEYDSVETEETRAKRAIIMAEGIPEGVDRDGDGLLKDADSGGDDEKAAERAEKHTSSTYLRFESEDEELEWIENNDFIRLLSPWLYFLASTLAFIWAQSFYWWKRLPEEEQICVRDTLGDWFCERGDVVQMTLRNHPLKGNLGNKSTLITWMVAFHTALAVILGYFSTLLPRCFRRSPHAGSNPSEERIQLLYIFARLLVSVGILCQWCHMWLMDTKYKGITNANWSLDFRSSLPFLGTLVAGSIVLFGFAIRSLNTLSTLGGQNSTAPDAAGNSEDEDAVAVGAGENALVAPPSVQGDNDRGNPGRNGLRRRNVGNDASTVPK